MGCNIPPGHVIPAIAARLKYYVEVQRKEAGFDLSVNQRDAIENYKLYQLPKGHGFHQTQRIRKNALDNQMEAALRLYSEKSNGEWNPNVQVNQERKQDVQRKIKKQMTSLTIPDSITSNIVYPRRARYSHSAPSDWEGKSSYLGEISPPDMPHEEFTRLISSAAKLIVATTPGKRERRTLDSNRKQLSSLRWKHDQCILHHRQKYRVNSSLKAKGDQSRHSVWLKIPSTLQESGSNTNSSNGEPAFTSCEGDADVGVKRNQTSTEADETKVKDVDYEITVRTGSSPRLNTEPELMIILVGKNGRTKKLRLQSSSTNSVPFRTGQVDIFKVKAKDTGTLTHIIIEGNQKGPDCRFYCRDIIVKKNETADEVHVFPCNGWLSSVQTTLHGHPKTHMGAGSATKAPPQGLQRKGAIKKTSKSSADDSKSSYDDKAQMIMRKAEMLSHRRIETTKKDGIKLVPPLKHKSNFIKPSFSPEFVTKPEPQTMDVDRSHDTGSRKIPSSPEEKNMKSGSNETSSNQISMGINLQYSDLTPGKYSLDESSNEERSEKRREQVVYSQIQNNIKDNVLEYGAISSPVGYVYFSHEKNKTFSNEKIPENIYMEMKPKNNELLENLTILTHPVGDKNNVDGIEKNTERYVDLQITKSINEHDLPESGKADGDDKVVTPNIDVQETSTTSIPDDHRGDKASQLLLLQQILVEPISHSHADSNKPDLRLTDNVEIIERADRQVNNYDGSLGDNDIQSTSTRNVEEDGSSCRQPSRAAHISGMYDGDESSYMSDTSDGEFLFSDTSLAISLSENESDFIVSLSRSGSVRSQSEDTSEEDDLRRRIGNPIQKRRKSRQDASRIFQRALDMIKKQDMTRLRDMCQHNFFHLSCTDKEGKTLLHHAATHGSEHTCQVLLDSNVGLININKQDIFGKTALHYAMQTGNNKTIKLLLNKGAKSAYEIQNSSGPSTLEDPERSSMSMGLS